MAFDIFSVRRQCVSQTNVEVILLSLRVWKISTKCVVAFSTKCNIEKILRGVYYVTVMIGDYFYIGFITYFVAPSVRVSYYV